MNHLVKLLSFRSIGGTTLCQLIILLCGVVSGITLARTLGPSGRGELAVALLWPGILILFGDLGLGFAFSYYAGKNQEINELWTLAIVAGVIIGGGFALVGWFALPYFVPVLAGEAHQVFGVALLAVPMVLTSGYQSYLLLGKGFIADFSAIRVSTAAANMLSVLLFAMAGFTTVRWFVISFVLTQASGLLSSTFLIQKRFAPRLRFTSRLIRNVASYGFSAQLASVAAQTNLRADQAVMSVVFTTQQLGLYVVAVSLSGILSPFLTALAVVILPRATHSESDTSGALLVARHVKLAFILSLPVLLLAWAVMPWLLPFFFGGQYTGAILSAQVLVVAGLFQGLNAVLGNGLRGLGRPGFPALAEGIGILATLLFLFLLLHPYGILGAAMASLIAYVIVGFVQFALIARTAGMRMGRLVLSPMNFTVIDESRQFLRALAGRYS